MRFRSNRLTDTGHGQKLWPVLALLLLTVALPTAGVLWFMGRAMQNERDAVRQRLTEVYNSQLETAAARAESAWDSKLALLTQIRQQKRGPAGFAEIIRYGIADSALFYENGYLKYPDPEVIPSVPAIPETRAWKEAERLEYELRSLEAAAKAYGEIARQTEQTRVSAMAVSAQARCLNKAGQSESAIEVLVRTLGGERYRNATDAQGRLLQPNSQLFALQLMEDSSHPLFAGIAKALFERLNDYGSPLMPSSQRRFLMRQLQAMWPECPQFPTLAAEETAAKFSKAGPAGLRRGRLHQMSDQKLWVYQTSDKSVIALFRQDSLQTFLDSAVVSDEKVPGIQISALAPGATAAGAFLSKEIKEVSPDWRLILTLSGADPFESVSSQNIATYVWTGILMTAAIALLSFLLARYLQRQVRLTRLKNDLIATVSHELKTPLASMRLLVDTLRDGHYQDTQLVREYLEMISKENARLSSLIEGFLTFSRMERKKTKFDRTILETGEIVQAALEAVGDRLQAPGCSLELDLAPALPPVIGDRDALITVLVNLLDNALKYSGDEKKIRLRGFASDGSVFLEIRDNGIGFPRSAAKKIFDRFYQVDQTLSRNAGGCGLGLSIVKFIIAAHNGSISAKSQQGKGSTFTVRLPAASA
jgi:signal transduction histidine kinase